MQKTATVKRSGLLVLTAVGALFALGSQPAMAQKFGGPSMKSNKLDKVHFYNAPREVQILDERPNIRDFREAPSSSPMIALPPGPMGGAGGYGGSGGGALGEPGGMGGDGAPIQLGPAPGQLPYRTPNPSSLPLPKTGFDRQPSNIPAGGMAPRNALPSGTTTNRLMGKMMPPKTPTGQSAGGPVGWGVTNRPKARGTVAPAAAPMAASYGDNYGGAGGFGGGGNRTEGVVRGSLLRKAK